MFALPELRQFSDSNLQVEQGLCFWTLKNGLGGRGENVFKEREREKGINRGAYRGEQKIASKLGTHRPIDICILLFAQFSILDP